MYCIDNDIDCTGYDDRVRQSTANGIDTYTGFRQLTGSM
jgi:hypothetical protein